MIRFQPLKPLAAGVGAALVLIACGGTSTGGGSASKGTIEIGVDAPLSGAEASQGQPMANGIELYVQDHPTLKGYTVKVKTFDDVAAGVHDPAKGAQNIQAMIGDTKILGMVGPYNSSVAKAEIPVAAGAGLTMISPGNTNECLTRDDLDCAGAATQLRQGNPNPYFRVSTLDTNQGPAAARYAFEQLHVTKVAVASDNGTYGKGIADNFQAEFKSLGGQVVKRQDFDTKSTDDFKPFLLGAKNAGAQGVYFGGDTDGKACVPRNQMAGIFPATTPYLGGDAIALTPACVTQAGSNAPGLYATVPAIDPAQVPGAKSVIQHYVAKYGKQNLTTFSILGYDSAGVLLAAIGRAIDADNGNLPKRAQVRDQMPKTDYQGTLGPVSFDQYGDIKTKIISIYEYTSTDANDATSAPWKGQYDFGQTPPKFQGS